MAIEPRRACGYRKVGGLYLCDSGAGVACDRLSFPLTVCPTCHAGIKQSRGWTWVDVAGLTGGVHPNCEDDFPCPFCMATGEMGQAGLLWIGERFYKTPAHFLDEAGALGISKRVSAIPRGFKVGETWVLLAHPRAVFCGICFGKGKLGYAEQGQPEMETCADCDGKGYRAGIFRIFRPARIEKIITESQSRDAEFMDDLRKKGLTPVIVPDNDPDHQGSVYDKDDETAELFEGGAE